MNNVIKVWCDREHHIPVSNTFISILTDFLDSPTHSGEYYEYKNQILYLMNKMKEIQNKKKADILLPSQKEVNILKSFFDAKLNNIIQYIEDQEYDFYIQENALSRVKTLVWKWSINNTNYIKNKTYIQTRLSNVLTNWLDSITEDINIINCIRNSQNHWWVVHNTINAIANLNNNIDIFKGHFLGAIQQFMNTNGYDLDTQTSTIRTITKIYANYTIKENELKNVQHLLQETDFWEYYISLEKDCRTILNNNHQAIDISTYATNMLISLFQTGASGKSEKSFSSIIQILNIITQEAEKTNHNITINHKLTSIISYMNTLEYKHILSEKSIEVCDYYINKYPIKLNKTVFKKDFLQNPRNDKMIYFIMIHLLGHIFSDLLNSVEKKIYFNKIYKDFLLEQL